MTSSDAARNFGKNAMPQAEAVQLRGSLSVNRFIIFFHLRRTEPTLPEIKLDNKTFGLCVKQRSVRLNPLEFMTAIQLMTVPATFKIIQLINSL
jgi:hypothetical protein